MQGMALGLALASIAMSSIAQILLKAGMSGPAVRGAIEAGGTAVVLRAVALSPGVVTGLALYGLGAMLWLAVLAKAEVSQAYPFVALGFVVTGLLGWMMFDDAMGPARMLGIGLIVVGVVLVGRS